MFDILVLITIIILAIAAYSRLVRQRKTANVTGWVLRQDLDGRGGKYHFNDQLGIGCKPDVEENGKIVEYKKAACYSNKPMPGDLLQVAGEMLATGAKVAELRFGNSRVFTFTRDSPEIQEAMTKAIEIIHKMRAHLAENKSPCGTPTPRKCVVCHFGTRCPDAAQ